MSRTRRTTPAPLPTDHYFMRSRQPLHSLMLLLPFIIVYELGAFWYANEAIGRRLAARAWVQRFFEMFGAAGEYLPGLAVVVVLVTLHFTQRRRWRFQPGLYLAMAAESLALAAPLLLFSRLTGPPAAALAASVSEAGGVGTPVGSWQAWMIFSLGAGLYEELVFRMFLIAAVHFLLVDLLRVAHRNGATAAVLTSALLFALAHFHKDNPFNTPAFAFYFISGFYFALIYLLRGFGIVVATHAFYDICAVAWEHGLLR